MESGLDRKPHGFGSALFSSRNLLDIDKPKAISCIVFWDGGCGQHSRKSFGVHSLQHNLHYVVLGIKRWAPNGDGGY
jgi:hypothetical protein